MGKKRGGCGRSKTNGPIKSFKGAAIYLLCVTGWRFTSLIRPGTYQHCVFFSFPRALQWASLSFSLNWVWSQRKQMGTKQQQSERAASPRQHFQGKKFPSKRKESFHVWKSDVCSNSDETTACKQTINPYGAMCEVWPLAYLLLSYLRIPEPTAYFILATTYGALPVKSLTNH